MNEGLLYVLVGGLIGYGGSIIQHFFAIKQQKKDDIWKEKIRIYSKVIEEIGKSFIELEALKTTSATTLAKAQFALRLGSILSPARLIASNMLESKLRDLYEKEITWFESISNIIITEKGKEEISTRSFKIRYEVEQAMRKELKL